MTDVDTTTGAHVAIILCTYNGSNYLREQLESIESQDHEDWELWVSDDGSTDNTLDILAEFQQKSKRPVHVLNGSKRGYSFNFQTLFKNPEIVADYFALCDQDDIWLNNKLSKSIRLMREKSIDLYGGRTELIDDHGESIGYSPLFKRPPSFRNALVQSLMGGNTMVFGPEAIRVVRNSAIADVVSHDWWYYLLLTGAGKTVYYDPTPSVRYRQHGSNSIGSNNSFSAKLTRLKWAANDRFRIWIDRNLTALQASSDLLTDENRAFMDKFIEIRSRKGLRSTLETGRCGVYRQSLTGNAAMYAARFFGKL